MIQAKTDHVHLLNNMTLSILGMLLTLSDAGNKKIILHGGQNLTHMLAATRGFVFRFILGTLRRLEVNLFFIFNLQNDN